MFIITGTKVELTYQVMSFMSKIYPNLIDVDIEVVQKDLTEDNVFGWTLENNDQNEIEIHDDLSEKDYITTLIPLWKQYQLVQRRLSTMVQLVR